MKLLLVSPDDRLPSARIRLARMAPWLEALGAEVERVEYPRAPFARRALARGFARYDVVVVHRRLPTLGEAARWRAARAPLVFDFDDALRYRNAKGGRGHRSLSRELRFAFASRATDAFSCGSRALAAHVRATGKPIAIQPSPVPIDVPQRGDGPPRGPLRVGWIGGRGNIGELRSLARPLAALARRVDVVLVVVSDTSIELAGVPVEHRRWSLAGQEAEIARLDVGVMPLADTPWNRGKCAYKLLQYMAAGVPSVASPVGANADVVEHGENGLLAAGDRAWTDALERLALDAGLRRRLGRAGRETVVERYSYGILARAWLAFLGSLADGPAPPGGQKRNQRTTSSIASPSPS